MLRSTIEAAVREEVRAILRDVPTPVSVSEDLGNVLGSLPPAEATDFAKALLTKLWEFIDKTTESESEPPGAEGTGEQEE